MIITRRKKNKLHQTSFMFSKKRAQSSQNPSLTLKLKPIKNQHNTKVTCKSLVMLPVTTINLLQIAPLISETTRCNNHRGQITSCLSQVTMPIKILKETFKKARKVKKMRSDKAYFLLLNSKSPIRLIKREMNRTMLKVSLEGVFLDKR
jgi:hypothetical protein